MRTHIRNKTDGDALQHYQKEKFNWSNEVLNQICWKELGSVLAKYKPVKQTRTIQMMYNWQYVGRRRELITGTGGKCKGCGMEETKLHYLTCNAQFIVNKQKKVQSLLKSQLEAMNTYPGVITAIMYILQEGITDKWKSTIETSGFLDSLLLKAIDQQQQIGDMNLARGFLTTRWAIVQQAWDKIHICKKYKGVWIRDAIMAIQTYTLECWKLRNEYEYGGKNAQMIQGLYLSTK